MRKAVIACLVGLAAINGVVVTSQALAQGRSGQQPQQQKQKQRPPPPPAARCPDLGVGTYAFVNELPGEAPLSQGEVAVTWAVRNDGNTPYAAAAVEDQSVALEYTTAAGATRLALVPAITTRNEEGLVVLAHGHSVRGAIRAQLPDEARGRRLRLRLVYAAEGTRAGIPDCNEANNSVNLVRTAPSP